MSFADTLSDAGEDACYELYHESSKIGRRVRPLPLVRSARGDLHQRAEELYPLFVVGEADPAADSVAALIGRPAAPLRPGRLTLRLLASLLTTPAATDSELAEVTFHVRAVDGLPAGLYRLGAKGAARLIRRGDLGKEVARTLLAPGLAGAPLQIVIAGAFAAAAAIGGERGYRRALLAAGARAQAIAIAAAALGLGAATTTDFYDRELDGLLGLDGIDFGALVLIAIGATG
jgi:nitroreductase